MYQKLKLLRLQKGYSQKQVGKWLHLSQNAYAKLENGDTRLKVEDLFALAHLFEISPTRLLEELGPYYPETPQNMSFVPLNSNSSQPLLAALLETLNAISKELDQTKKQLEKTLQASPNQQL